MFILSSTNHNKEATFIHKISNQIRNLTTPLKAQLLNPTLITGKDLGPQKPLPEVLVYEKKTIHGRPVIQKTRTLPHIKNQESNSDQKSAGKKQNNTFCDPSSISIKNKVKISIRNPKVYNLFKPLDQSSSIKVEITACEDAVMPIVKTYLATPHLLATPKGTITVNKTPTKKNTLNSPSLSPSASERICSSDPYYYLNYLKHINITSFYCILDCSNETNVGNFMYLNRVVKKNPRIQTSLKTVKANTAKSHYDCACYDKKIDFFKKVRLAKQKELKLLIPSLERVFLYPQSVRYNDNLVIVNFENVIGNIKNEQATVKEDIVKVLRKLSRFFKIILVQTQDWQKSKGIVQMIENHGITLSGIYKVVQPLHTCWELRNMQDYSIIFQDFAIAYPETQAFVICAHKIAEVFPDNQSEFIASKQGLGVKLNLERVPVPFQDQENTPITVLVQNIAIRDHLSPLKKFLKSVNDFKKNEKISQLNFKSLLMKTEEFIESNVVHKIMTECFKGFSTNIKKHQNKLSGKSKPNVLFCKLHKKPVCSFAEKFCENVFII